MDKHIQTKDFLIFLLELNNSLIIQFGRTGSVSDVTVTLPLAYKTFYNIVTGMGIYGFTCTSLSMTSLTQFYMRSRGTGGELDRPVTWWITIGT